MFLQGLADRHYFNALFFHGTVNRGIIHLDKSPYLFDSGRPALNRFQHFCSWWRGQLRGVFPVGMFFRRPGELRSGRHLTMTAFLLTAACAFSLRASG